jgi:hypothetical protein
MFLQFIFVSGGPDSPVTEYTVSFYLFVIWLFFSVVFWYLSSKVK